MPVCCCPCHKHARAAVIAAKQHDKWQEILDATKNPALNAPSIVSTTDVLEAALACPRCLPVHSDALLTRTIWAPLPFLMPDGTEFEGETGG